ncbi:hypothetical protein LCGC14_1261500 [marine sediment metagenome]|uniref:Fibronectin type-III domain-containing protein n=1 Tax=marine sediment metagenome TaxID=412755 RepID=A0A0F9LLR2_9ZZZZ
MGVSIRETCQEYLKRRLSEGWAALYLNEYKVVLFSPDGGIRRELDLRNDVETLRPNGAGSLTQQSGTPGANWANVDDAGGGDGDSSYNYEGTFDNEATDFYALPASSGSGTINKITVYGRVKMNEVGSFNMFNIRIWTNSTIYSIGKTITTSYVLYSGDWVQNPFTTAAWTWAEIDALEIGDEIQTNVGGEDQHITQVYVEVDYTPPVVPTVTTQAATSVEATTATGNGNITNTGGENCDYRGIAWDTVSRGDPGGLSPAASAYANYNSQGPGSYGTGAFTRSITGLPTGDTIYARAYAHNSAGWNWGAQVSFLTKPAAPTSVVASDNLNDKVTITWVKATGATGYQIYRDGTPLGWLGDVATGDDTGAGAPSITPGAAVAGDGLSTAHVSLSITGEGTNNGTTHTYKVRARNATGESVDSATDTGKRIPGALTCQWQRSAADSDASYSNISGTTEAYDDTGAPAPTITPGTASATDGPSTAYVTLSLAGESANIGAGRYYRCVLNASGCTQQITGVNRGYRGVGGLTYQWRRSAGDSDASYSNIGGATTDPYNDTGAPAGVITPGTASATNGSSAAHVTLSLAGESVADGAGRWYYCEVSATGAVTQDSTHNRGYRGVGALTRQWYRSAGDSDATYSLLSGATTDPYNDTTAPAPTITPGTGDASDGTSSVHVALSLSGQSANVGAGRFYKCLVSATGASSQYSTANRGYRAPGALTYQWQRSAADSDASYSNIGGATTDPYNDTGAPGNGEGRYFQCVENATGAAEQTSSSDRGYRWMGGKTAGMAAKMIMGPTTSL